MASASPRLASPDFALGLACGPFWLRGSLVLSIPYIYLCGPSVAVPRFERWFFYSPLVQRRLGRGWSDDIQRWIRLWLRLKFIPSWGPRTWNLLGPAQVIRATADRRRPVMHGLCRFSMFLCFSIEAMFYGYSYPSSAGTHYQIWTTFGLCSLFRRICPH